jgi:hypothetical protein
MKLAIMQPYFFPYIGYWQLIHAVDTFVMLDDVQFMRHGWIERNRIHNPNGGWQYVAVPLESHSHKDLIRNVRARETPGWKERLSAQLNHYRRLTPYFAQVRMALLSIIDPIEDRSIARINAAIIRGVCKMLGMDRTLLIASECGFDYSDVRSPGDWALRISQQLAASEYVNPVGGAALFDATAFSKAGISLRFLQAGPVAYRRAGEFIPDLSIIDVLMFNGIPGTRSLLDRCSLPDAG